MIVNHNAILPQLRIDYSSWVAMGANPAGSNQRVTREGDAFQQAFYVLHGVVSIFLAFREHACRELKIPVLDGLS